MFKFGEMRAIAYVLSQDMENDICGFRATTIALAVIFFNPVSS